VVLENHGIVTVGATIEAACNLNEMVEESAKIQLLVMTLVGRDAINLAKLKEKFKTQNTVE
jgi:ribulose-5-phosphate 4-epimerase/fuculose-1-phosphate aldolase